LDGLPRKTIGKKLNFGWQLDNQIKATIRGEQIEHIDLVGDLPGGGITGCSLSLLPSYAQLGMRFGARL
jgi:hypothetical protein